jgi:xylose isomerase
VYDATSAMLVVLGNGGLHSGGLNFDAHIRRNSTDLEDLFHAHIGGMDSFALALEIAQGIVDRGLIKRFRDERYASFNSGDGARFEKGELDLSGLRDIAASGGEIPQISGKQELIENLINQIMFSR